MKLKPFKTTDKYIIKKWKYYYLVQCGKIFKVQCRDIYRYETSLERILIMFVKTLSIQSLYRSSINGYLYKDLNKAKSRLRRLLNKQIEIIKQQLKELEKINV